MSALLLTEVEAAHKDGFATAQAHDVAFVAVVERSQPVHLPSAFLRVADGDPIWRPCPAYSDAHTIGQMIGESDPERQCADIPDNCGEQVGSDVVPLEPTTVRLDDETRRFLREEATRQGTSDSDIARQAITFYRGWLARERHEPARKPGDRRT